MKFGYSNLLGEYVQADSLEHRDCEPFQIVCPSCHEPLFKVERKPGDDTLHYLSHYKQSASYASECELRAESTSRVDRKSHNSESRDQKLKYFLQVFLSALERDPFFSYRKGLNKTHKDMNQSKAWVMFRNVHLDTARRGGLEKPHEFRSAADFYLNEISQFGAVPKTGFSVSMQTQIANDIFATLLTPPGKPSYEALFNHAAIHLLARCNSGAVGATPESEQVLRNIAYFVSGLMRSSKRAGLQLMADMNASPIYPPYVEQPTTYVIKVASEIAHEMVGTLVRLPYFELLTSNIQAKGAPGA